MLIESLLGIRAETPDPLPRAPWDDFWYSAPVDTMAGARVGSDTALRIATVFMCVAKISQAIGSLPMHVYRRLPRGGKERATSHPLYRLLHAQPNSLQTSMDWREQIMVALLLRGTHYSEIIGGRAGSVESLIPLESDAVTPELLPNGRLRYRIRLRDGGERLLAQEQVLRIAGLSANGLIGLNPIEYNRETFGITLAQLAYGARFYKNNAQPGGIIELDPTLKFANAEAKKAFRRAWEDMQAGANVFRTAVLDPGMKYREVGMKHTDAQYLELMKFNQRQIAGLFGVPAHKLGDLERAHFANLENQNLEWVIDTLRPWCVRIEQAIQRDLVTEDDIFVEINLEGLLRGDSAARTQFYRGGIQNGWLTRNEVREKENLNPIEGLDEPLVPQNMAPANDAASDDAAAPAPSPSAPPEGAAARLERVLRASIQSAIRLEFAHIETAARRKANDSAAYASALKREYQEHEKYLVERLSLTPKAARQYCEWACALALREGAATLATSASARAEMLYLFATEGCDESPDESAAGADAGSIAPVGIPAGS